MLVNVGSEAANMATAAKAKTGPGGRQYRAVVDLWYPTDPAIIARLLAGERIPMRARGLRHVTAGTVITDMPAVSIAGQLAKGRIVEVQEEQVSDAPTQ